MKIWLEELTAADLPQLNRWRNDPDTTAALAAPFRYINLETDERWFKAYLDNRAAQVRCCIRVKGANAPVGLISLTDLDPVSHHAQVHILIGERQYRAQGFGAQALRLMVQHAFANLNLHRLYAYILADNEPSLRLFKGAGFQAEGLMRQAAFKQGHYKDIALFGLLSDHSNDANHSAAP